MLHAILVLAAEAGGHEETSKTAFYVAGGLLAVWAVVLSAVGLTRPGFPGTIAVSRGVALLSGVLVAAAMATAVLTG
jgi:hypothetical protein